MRQRISADKFKSVGSAELGDGPPLTVLAYSDPPRGACSMPGLDRRTGSARGLRRTCRAPPAMPTLHGYRPMPVLTGGSGAERRCHGRAGDPDDQGKKSHLIRCPHGVTRRVCRPVGTVSWPKRPVRCWPNCCCLAVASNWQACGGGHKGHQGRVTGNALAWPGGNPVRPFWCAVAGHPDRAVVR